MVNCWQGVGEVHTWTVYVGRHVGRQGGRASAGTLAEAARAALAAALQHPRWISKEQEAENEKWMAAGDDGRVGSSTARGTPAERSSASDVDLEDLF